MAKDAIQFTKAGIENEVVRGGGSITLPLPTQVKPIPSMGLLFFDTKRYKLIHYGAV